MSFAVKLDENLSRAHVDLLRQAGYDTDRVHDGLSGAADEQVWERACVEHRLFVTLDLDFPMCAGTNRAPIQGFC